MRSKDKAKTVVEPYWYKAIREKVAESNRQQLAAEALKKGPKRPKRDENKEIKAIKKAFWNRRWREANIEVIREKRRIKHLLSYDSVKAREAYWRFNIRLAIRQFEEAKAWRKAHPEAMARCPI